MSYKLSRNLIYWSISNFSRYQDRTNQLKSGLAPKKQPNNLLTAKSLWMAAASHFRAMHREGYWCPSMVCTLASLMQLCNTNCRLILVVSLTSEGTPNNIKTKSVKQERGNFCIRTLQAHTKVVPNIQQMVPSILYWTAIFGQKETNTTRKWQEWWGVDVHFRSWIKLAER